MTQQEPLKITLDDLEGDEAPAKPEPTRSRLQQQAESTGKQVAGAAKDVAGKVSQKLADSAADVTNRTAEAAREKMSEAMQAQSKAIADAVEQRVRQIDWKAEAQKGAEGGLRWLSGRLTELADRMKETPAADEDAAKEPPQKAPPADS